MLDLDSVRDDFPALSRSVYLNTGGVAPLPRPLHDRLQRDLEERYLSGPPLNLRRESFQAEKDTARAGLARFLGVEPDEICFTRGVSDGANIVFNGLPWQAGDEIILSDEEYPSFILPALALAQRRGVVVRILHLDNDEALILDRFQALLGPRTRLVALSHVTTDNGIRLPATEICRLAHRAGAAVYYDGAQAVGQFPVDLGDIGCDFYSLLSYKWLLGPYSAGILYVRRERLPDLAADWVGARATSAYDLEAGTFELLPTARRYEFGPFSWPLYFALAEAAAYLQRLGLDDIEAAVRRQVEYLQKGLCGIPGVRLLSPEVGPLSTGIVAFSLEGTRGEEVSDTLRSRWNIITRATNVRFDGVRVCVALFTTRAELDILLEAVATLAGDVRSAAESHPEVQRP